MPDRTKRDLEEALKRQLLRKPLDKITIGELASVAGISRMTFYYHFRDIYDLVEWSCIEDARKALGGKRTYGTWTEGLRQIFEAVYVNKPFIMNVYHSVGRERIERFLGAVTSDLIIGVVNEKAEGKAIPDDKKAFIAQFYTYSFIGVMLEWIDGGMMESYQGIVDDIAHAMKGNIINSIANFTAT